MDRLRRVVGSLPFRVLVTAGLLVLVATRVDWSAAGERLADGEWGWFAAAVGLLVAALVVGAERWHFLLHAAGIDSPRLQTLRAYAIGVFSNNFLPTGFGGDAARAWIVGRSRAAMTRAATSVVVDRLTSICCLVLVAWGATALAPASVPEELLVLLAVASGAGLVAAGVLFLGVRSGHGIARRLPARVQRIARETRGTLVAYARDRWLIGAALLLGVIFQLLMVTAAWFLAKAIEIDVSFAVIAVVTPLVLLITLLPISVAGFGLREGSYAVLLAEAGVSTTAATLLSLLTVAALAASSLPGAFALLLPGARPPAARATEPSATVAPAPPSASGSAR